MPYGMYSTKNHHYQVSRIRNPSNSYPNCPSYSYSRALGIKFCNLLLRKFEDGSVPILCKRLLQIWKYENKLYMIGQLLIRVLDRCKNEHPLTGPGAPTNSRNPFNALQGIWFSTSPALCSCPISRLGSRLASN